MEDIKRMKIISEALTSSGTRWWIDHGTLLGIIRESRLLAWDNDIDISILETDLEKAFNAIKKRKKELSAQIIQTKRNIKIIPFNAGKDIDISSYAVSAHKPGVYIKSLVEFPRKKGIRAKELRKFIWRRCRKLEIILREKDKYHNEENSLPYILPIDFLMHNITKTRESMGLYHQSTVPQSYFDEFTYITWENLTLPIPNKPEKYLEFRYGEDWRTPKEKWKWWRDDKSVN